MQHAAMRVLELIQIGSTSCFIHVAMRNWLRQRQLRMAAFCLSTLNLGEALRRFHPPSIPPPSIPLPIRSSIPLPNRLPLHQLILAHPTVTRRHIHVKSRSWRVTTSSKLQAPKLQAPKLQAPKLQAPKLLLSTLRQTHSGV